MSFETLLYETRDGVAYITLNREDAANAINLEMGRDLMLAECHTQGPIDQRRCAEVRQGQ